MSLSAMTAVFYTEGVTAHEKIVLLALADHAWEDGSHAFPSRTRMSVKTALSEATVKRTLARLVTKGYLEIQEAAYRYRPTVYRLTDLVMRQGGQVAPPEQGGQIEHQGGQNAPSGGSPGDPLTVSNPQTEPPRSSRSSATVSGYSAEFETFWAAYPRKVAKKTAWRVWQSRRRQGVTADSLIRAAELYRDQVAREGKPLDKVKHAATFIGPDEHWVEILAGEAPTRPQEPRKVPEPPEDPRERQERLSAALRAEIDEAKRRHGTG